MKRIVVLVIMLITAAGLSFAQSRRPPVILPLEITAGLISGGGVGNPTGTGRIDVDIDRWSTDSERTTLVRALAGKGERSLLDELQKARKVGSVRFNTQLAWDLRYARQLPAPDGGVRVVLVTDRPMPVWEIWNQPRYAQYPFTLVELAFNADGQPTNGAVILAARVTADEEGRFITVENFASQPVQMTDIRIENR